jgi:hypothetical protein
MPGIDACAVPVAQWRRHGASFWIAAFALLIVIASRRCRVLSTVSTEREITSRPS